MSRKSPFDEVARDLIELALAFHRGRVWSRVSSDDPFLVRLPGEDVPSVVSVLGSEKHELGLMLLEGEGAVATYEHWIVDGEGWRPDAPAPMSLMTFESAHTVEPRFLRHLASAKTPFAAHAAVPLFLRLEPGADGKLMGRTEMRTFAKRLQVVLEADRQGVLITRPWDKKRRMLELAPEGPGRKARVIDRVVTLPATEAPTRDQVPAAFDWTAEREEGGGGISRLGAGQPGSRNHWLALDIALTRRLIDLTQPAGRGPYERANAKYFGHPRRGIELLSTPEGDPVQPPFFDWYLFTYRARKGAATFAEKLRASGSLDAQERRLLDARIAARTVFVRVTAIEEGASVELEELSTGKREILPDVSLSKSAEVGLGLLLRLYRIDGHTFAQIAGPAMHAMALMAAVERLESNGLSLAEGSLHGDLSQLGRLWLDPPHMPRPTLQNTDGEPLELIVLRYRVPEGMDLGAALVGLPGIVEDDDGHWTWTVHRENETFENGVVYSHMAWVGDELHASANSKRRAERVREHLAPLRRLMFLGLNEPAPLERGGGREPAPSPEEARAIQDELQDVVQRHMTAWLDMSIPALGGRTPRAAYADPAKRESVLRLLRTTPPSMGPLGPVMIDVERLVANLDAGR